MIEQLKDRRYVAGIRNGLDDAFERAPVEDLAPARTRIAVFSDHHRGAGDKADDFRACEHAYTTALGFYLEHGYRLFALGDVEELWEEKPEAPLRRYEDVLALEAEFRTRGAGLERFWGNHDDGWADPGQARRHLEPVCGGPLEVREGLRLRVRRERGGEATLFFVHGHQGTRESDRLGALSRLPVRLLWRPIQRLTGWSATTPSADHALRAKHDRAMFEWARGRRGVVLVAGHTHRPVFARSVPDPPPTRPVPELRAALAQARAAGDAAGAAAARAELEYALTARRRPDSAVTVEPPCYFNTGCCSFPDGDVTGLEIADGEIRLVRWPANVRELRPEGGEDALNPEERVLARAQLDAVLDAVLGEEEPSVHEQPVLPLGA